MKENDQKSNVSGCDKEYVPPTVSLMSIQLENENFHYQLDVKADFLQLLVNKHKRQRLIM